MLLHWGQRSLISPVQSYLLANFPASYCRMGIGTARLLLSSFLLTCLFVISTTASVMTTHRLILIGRFNIFIYSLALVHIVLQLFFCGCLYINSLFPILKKEQEDFWHLKKHVSQTSSSPSFLHPTEASVIFYLDTNRSLLFRMTGNLTKQQTVHFSDNS